MSNVIHESFKHGDNFQIGHFCVIEEDVVVGDNVKIGSYVFLGKGTVIGDYTFIDSYTKSSGSNKVGNNVTLRYNSTIARKVTIEDDVFISPNVMTIYSEYDGTQSPGTLIKKGSFIGTSAVLGPGVTIGQNVVIGAMAYVTRDCLDGGIYYGAPARFIKKR